jgi:hypothetical protein
VPGPDCLHPDWVNRFAGENGCKLPVSPAPVVCVMSLLLLGVPAVEQEDHANRDQALLFDPWAEIGQ